MARNPDAYEPAGYSAPGHRTNLLHYGGNTDLRQPARNSNGLTFSPPQFRGPAHAGKIPRMSSRGSRSGTEVSWQGYAFSSLPAENQRVINQVVRTLDSWEDLAILSSSRGETIPETKLREMQKLIHAADGYPLDSTPSSASNPTPYTGSTYTPRSHNPPPNPGPLYYHQHTQRPHGSPGSTSSSVNRSGSLHRKRSISSRADSDDEIWLEEVDVPWEDRFKAGRSHSREMAKSPRSKTGSRGDGGKVTAGQKRERKS